MDSGVTFYLDKKGRLISVQPIWGNKRQTSVCWVTMRKANDIAQAKRLVRPSLPKRITELEARLDLAAYAKRKRLQPIFINGLYNEKA